MKKFKLSTTRNQKQPNVGATSSPLFKEMTKYSKAITLISLVITIIVLLILAGVTLNLTLGEKGIFTTAHKAAQNYKDAQERELADLAGFENTLNGTIDDVLGPRVILSATKGLTQIGKTITLTARVYSPNEEDKSITWSTSNPSIAIVSNGVITGVGGGHATITATSASGLKASCEVAVVNYGTSIQDNYETIYTTTYPNGFDGYHHLDTYVGENSNYDKMIALRVDGMEKIVVEGNSYGNVYVNKGDNEIGLTESVSERWVNIELKRH